MARTYDDTRREPEAPATETGGDATSTSSTATFTSSGPIPPVDTVTTTTAPTASERAFGPHPKGPGVQAVEALFASGKPEPDKVVAVIDAHRDERDAIFAARHDGG
jgi:hypothetical protein